MVQVLAILGTGVLQWRKFVLLLALVCAQVLPVAGWALPPPPYVPDALAPWRQWVLNGDLSQRCAALGDTRHCNWPGHLQLTVTGKSGRFTLDIWQDQEAVVALPGGPQAWPQQVAVDGAPALVLAVPGPAVRVGPGHHTLTGEFAFAEPPQALAVPGDVAAIELSLDGTVVDAPRRDTPTQLLLQQVSASQRELDSLSGVILRQWRDGVPLLVTTRLVLRVGGRPRDVVLGPVLPAGAQPIAVRSPLPLQVGQDGAVRVYVRPGEHILEIDAVVLVGTGPLQPPEMQGTFWEPTETWVWQPNEAVRGVELSGLTPVDPERTQMPQEWKGGRTFLASPGDQLKLQEVRRGEAEPPPNQLRLQRTWWLALDGSGLTTHDVISGEMHRDWRLSAGPALQLGQVAVTVDGKPEAQLITQLAGQTGVELRSGVVALTADGQLPTRSGELAAVGWQTDVQQLSIDLHLPPGWQLLTATGVDDLPETWLNSWNLLDFFFVLMVAFACGKLLGWPWAAVAAVALALCHREQDAPEFIWLVLLATTALGLFLPAGKLQRLVGWGHGAALLVLVTLWLPFAASQVRGGLYPQTSDSGSWQPDFSRQLADNMAKAAAPPATPAAEEIAVEVQEEPLEDAQFAPKQAALEQRQATQEQAVVRAKRMERKSDSSDSDYGFADTALSKRQVQRMDPSAVVQTGPGLPTWQWQSLRLGWHGPVRADQTVELFLLPPSAHLLLAILRVLLTGLLLLRLVGMERLRAQLQRLRGALGTAVVVLAVAATMTAAPTPAVAQEVPSADVLAELKQRLLAADTCEGPCVVVSRLDLVIRDRVLTLRLDVSAQRDAAAVLPGLVHQLALRKVSVDGQPTWALRRTDAGLYAVRVPVGRHVVQAELLLPARAVLDLPLPDRDRPQLVVFDGPGWRLDGLDNHGVPAQTLQLTRLEAPLAGAATNTAAEAGAATELPPWFSVTRRLELGLPWRVVTTITRLNAERPELVQLPLLPNETLLTADVRVVDAAGQRMAVVQFDRGEASVTLEGELPLPTSDVTLALAAPAGVPWTETWEVDCAPMWRCQHTGLVPVQIRDAASKVLQPRWQPWPGERLSLQVSRPAGAPGQAVTIEAAQLNLRPGERLLQATLTLAIRSSQGGWQTLTLPAGAEVQEVKLGGAVRPLRPAGSKLAIPLQPGALTVEVQWQQPWQPALWQPAPAVGLGGPAANVEVVWQVPASRWLLFARGPDWGPAILFWSRLVIAILAALALGRLGGVPLRTHQWLLLSLGLLQLPVPVSLVIVGWFVVMGWRGRYGKQELASPLRHNVLQLGLVGWTLAALGSLYAALHMNLVFGVDMQVGGAGSNNNLLRWYVDRVSAETPTPGYLSVPMWVWRGLMLAWAVWLVQSLLRWLPWALQAWLSGAAWRSGRDKHTAKAVTAAAVTADVAESSVASDQQP